LFLAQCYKKNQYIRNNLIIWHCCFHLIVYIKDTYIYIAQKTAVFPYDKRKEILLQRKEYECNFGRRNKELSLLNAGDMKYINKFLSNLKLYKIKKNNMRNGFK